MALDAAEAAAAESRAQHGAMSAQLAEARECILADGLEAAAAVRLERFGAV